MLANTLCHIPRVSLNKERLLWGQGVNTWAGCRTLAKNPDFLDSCERYLSQGNPGFLDNMAKLFLMKCPCSGNVGIRWPRVSKFVLAGVLIYDYWLWKQAGKGSCRRASH
jgi:hypothetical protein